MSEQLNQNIITKEGSLDLKIEHKILVEIERPAVIEKIKEARAQGDLSENAEFDAARENQGIIEDRIAEIERIIDESSVIGFFSNLDETTSSREKAFQKYINEAEFNKIKDLPVTSLDENQKLILLKVSKINEAIEEQLSLDKTRAKDGQKATGSKLKRENVVENKKSENENTDKIRIGSTVSIIYEDGDQEEYQIVGTLEADPFNNKISNISPLGSALINRKSRDIIEYTIEVKNKLVKHKVTVLDVRN